MKRKLIPVLIALMAVFTSCTDFLDIRQENSIPVSGLDYTNENNLFLPISAAYASTRNNDAFAFPYFSMLEISSDNADKGSIPSDGPAVAEIDTINFQPGNYLFNNIWTAMYNIVSVSNYAVESMDKFAAELPSPTARQLAIQYQGEAKTLRAMAYFYLVRIFGNIPAIYQSYTSDELANLPQSSSKEIYDRIEQDLEDAIKVLPNTQPSQYPGRYNKYTAMALKAKVHLYQNEFDSVANLTNQIIQSGQFFLLSDFRTYFSVLGKNSKESIIEIQSSTLGNTFGDVTFLEYAFQQGPRGNSPSDMQGWGFCVPSQDLINFYQARGEKIRPATTLLYRGTLTPEGDSIKHTCTNPVYNGKAYTPSEYNKWSYNGYGFNQNVRVLRYADVLLMYAEAIVRGASVPDGGKSAESAYAEVRTRAGLGTSGTPSLQDIWDERRAEFAMEEDRFFDLIRTGQAQSVFAKLGITFVPNVNNIFPIPSVQIDLNRNLKQNPGYN